MTSGTDQLAALSAAAYATDAEGRLTFYNEAAAELWGYRPALGEADWWAAWRLFRPDGQPLAYLDSPIAVAAAEGRPLHDVELVAERPDGTPVLFSVYSGVSSKTAGTLYVLIDIADRDRTDLDMARLAAIVASSDDAIISKTLDGRVTSWNAAATQIFGYTAEEMIGQSILRIIPPELQAEEVQILEKLRRGERIDHFDTVRLAKGGRRVDISLTVSPLRDREGRIVGASKIARDITQRIQNERFQRMLIDELNHRVKNALAMIQAIASQSLRHAPDPARFVGSFSGRLQALARAHDLVVERRMTGAAVADIVREQVLLGAESRRVYCAGPPVVLDAHAAVELALVLYELATNAHKYGALAMPEGRLRVTWRLASAGGRTLLLDWEESGVGKVAPPATTGFGTTLIKRSLKTRRGEAVMTFGEDGLVCRIRLPLPHHAKDETVTIERVGEAGRHAEGGPRPPDLRGRRILLLEDEALIALDLEAQLKALGCTVLGPAETIEAALRLVAEGPCDAALLDANIAGDPVGEVARVLRVRGIPFAFATGYGREGLPHDFQDAPILPKPFTASQLEAILVSLLAGAPTSRG